MNKKRICFFCERWASGGIEAFIHMVATQWDLSRWEIDVVAARWEDSVFTQSLRQRGIGIYELSGDLRKLRQNHRRFRQILRERHYDVVHLHTYQNLTLYYARIARQEGVTVRVAHSHNSTLRKSKTRWLKQRLHRVSCICFGGEATHLLACSEEAADFAFGVGGRRRDEVLYVPNGVDTQRFRLNIQQRQMVRKKLGVRDDFVIGNVGRLCPQKNQSFLLELFSHVRQVYPDSKLLLVGEGEDRDHLNTLAEQRKLEESAIVYGASAQVETLLWAMDLYVMPSLFEGLPIAVIEAQAAGLPVLCSDVVSRQVDVTGNVQFLPLQAGADLWAGHVLAMREALEPADRVLKKRADGADHVRAAGFDQASVCHQLEQIYEKGDGTNANA